MRDARESKVASQFKYGAVGWVENRMRLWRTHRADLAAKRQEELLAHASFAHSLLNAHHIFIHDHNVMQPRQGVLSQHAGGTHMHAPHGAAVDARTDGPVMRRSVASQSGDA